MAGKMRLEPLGNRVLLKRVEGRKQTEGGILLPGSLDEAAFQCEVVDVGPSVEGLGAGAVVYVNAEKKGVEVSFEQEKLLVVELDELLAVVAKD